MIQSGQILNSTNLNNAFVSTSYNNQIISGIKKFQNDLYSTKLIASTSDWNKQLILMHDGTNSNITSSSGGMILQVSNTNTITFKNSTTTTEDIVFRIDSSFAGITLNGDKGNSGGEPGGSYILFTQDAAGTKASIGLTQAANKDSTASTFTNALENALVIGSLAGIPVQLGSNSSVALTINTSNNIGIGTTSPSEKVHIVGDLKVEGSGSTIEGATVDNGSIIIGTTTKMGIDNNEIVVDGDNLYIGSKSHATILRVGATEYARLNSDGKFGIGTNSPAELLHVAGKVRVENLSLYSINQAPVLYFNSYYNSGDKYIANGSAYQLFHDTTNNKLRFRGAASGTADNAITFNEGLVIDTSGNIGIKPVVDANSLPYGLTVNTTLGMINGNNIELKASSGSPDDAGDIIFYSDSGLQIGRIWTATDTSSKLFISGSDTIEDLTITDNEVQVRRKLSIIGDYTGGTNYYPEIHFNHNSLIDKKVLVVYGGNGNGYGIYLESGGALIVGSGESASTASANLAATTEDLWITSDNNISIMTNIQNGYGNRKVITIGTDGVVIFANTNMSSTDRLVFNNTSGGWTGIKFNSGVNPGSDYGYIRYYDDVSVLSSNYDVSSGSAENSALVLGVENDEDSTSGDILILKGGNRVIIDVDASTRGSADPSYIVEFRSEQLLKSLINTAGSYIIKSGSQNYRNKGEWLSLFNSLGRQLLQNSDFLSNTLTGYAVYDNNNTGKVTLSLVNDETAPNTSGKVMRVSYTTGSVTSPDFGGFFYANYNVATSPTGFKQYKKGNRYLHLIWAKIPSGRTLNFASNTYGNEGGYKFLTDNTGNDDWKLYAIIQTIGVTGTFDTTGYWYISGGADANFTWDVAYCQVIGIDENPTIDRANSLNVGLKSGVDIGWGEIYSTGKITTEGKLVLGFNGHNAGLPPNPEITSGLQNFLELKANNDTNNKTGIVFHHENISASALIHENEDVNTTVWKFVTDDIKQKLNFFNGMITVFAKMSGQDDHLNSPISIREREGVAGSTTDIKYAPNLNFHWAGIVSRSLYMLADGNLYYGEYDAYGNPAGNLIWHAGNDGSGSGLDADLLDGLNSSSFLRSDADTTFAYGKKFYFAGMSGSTDPFYLVRVDANTNTSDLRLYIEDDANGSEQFSIWSGASAGGSTAKHQFLSNGNVYHAGNVGIGTTSPSEKIDVNGNIKVSGNLAVGTKTTYNNKFSIEYNSTDDCLDFVYIG